MKKVFISILAFFILLAPMSVSAQTPTEPTTPPSDDNTYSQPVRVPGQIGVPQTNPINVFNGPDIPDTPAPSNSGGKISNVNTCSAIKFKSALDILIWLKCVAVAILIPLIFAAAFVLFLWGVLKFMYAADAAKKKESQKLIWYGLIGLFVMVSVWGILKIVGTTLGIDPIAVPLLQTDYLNEKNASK
jgi:hypothetical protein